MKIASPKRDSAKIRKQIEMPALNRINETRRGLLIESAIQPNRRVEVKPRNAKALASQIEQMWDAAERENRDLTADERGQMEQLIEATKSQHRLEHEIASGVRLDAFAGSDDRPEEARLRLGQSALPDEPRQLAADGLDGLLDAVGIDVRHDDRDLEPPEEERRELCRHQAGADDPQALDPPGLGLEHRRRGVRARRHARVRGAGLRLA